MPLAEKTVEFVKQWIYGLYSRRSYQNWYIVKTDHSEFLLTLTEKRDLYAIKDRKSGHVYVLDGGDDIDPSSDNPFFVLFYKGFAFPNGVTRLVDTFGTYWDNYDQAERSVPNSIRLCISKFRVCDRLDLTYQEAPHSPFKGTSISLIAMGDRRFYTYPYGTAQDNTITLEDWATFKFESRFSHGRSDLPRYQFKEVLGRPDLEKVLDIRKHYLEIAGDRVADTLMEEEGWIKVPTNFKSVDELAGMAFLEARKTRPNPFHYNISPAISDYSKLSRRHETIAENGEFLRECITLDGDTSRDFHGNNWDTHIRKYLPADLASDYIAYFKADDAWLENNREVARASYLEWALRQNTTDVSGWIFVKPAEDTRFGPYEIYTRPSRDGNFNRLIPAPQFHTKVFCDLLGGSRVED